MVKFTVCVGSQGLPSCRVVCDYHPVEVSFEVKASSSLAPQRAFFRLSGGRRSDGLGSSIAL